MSYTYNLSTNVGKVRNLINDTTESSAQLSDEEIGAFLSQVDNDLLSAAALCCRKLATKYALQATSKTAGNYSENRSGISKAYLDLALEFEKRAEETPANADAEVIYTDFNYRQLIDDKVHRGEALDI